MNKNIGFILTATVLVGLGVAGVLVFRNSSNQSDLLYGINGELALESTGVRCADGGETCYKFDSEFFVLEDDLATTYTKISENVQSQGLTSGGELPSVLLSDPELVLRGDPASSGSGASETPEDRARVGLLVATGGPFGVYSFLETPGGELVDISLAKYGVDDSEEERRFSAGQFAPIADEDKPTLQRILADNLDTYVLVVSKADKELDYLEGVTRSSLSSD